MAEDAEDEDEAESSPSVELGEGTTVEGAPIARVASRLTWPIEQSEIGRKEGETVVRTPDGPRELGAVLDDVGTTYFATRREFVAEIRGAVGVGPVPTE